MTLIIIGITILVLCCLIAYVIYKVKPRSEAPIAFFVIAVFTFFALIIGVINYDTRHREYEEFMRERTVFTQTLNNSREHGREIEAAAIIKDVITWNQKLAEIQYHMGRPLIGEYYDKRFKNLKPIE